MTEKADLHVHTTYSDGILRPEELINLAKSKDFKYLSITDHDTVQGTVEALKHNDGIVIIPGIELSASYDNKEIHLLGYFIDPGCEKLNKYLKKIIKLRIQRNEKILAKLKELGVNINPDEFFQKYGYNCSIGRVHISNEIVSGGYAKDTKQAFDKYIGNYRPANVMKDNFDYELIIKLIKSAGGLSFLAHPGKYYKNRMIKDLVKAKLDGIEIIHPSHTKNDSQKLRIICRENSLLISGGSDFHGNEKSDYLNFGKFFVSSVEIHKAKEKLNINI